MNTSTQWGKPLRFLALLALASSPLLAQVRDLYMATTAKMPVYQGRHAQRLSLQVGDIVEGGEHPSYRDWLKIVVDGQEYDSKGKYFISRAAYRETTAREQAEIQSRIDRYTDRINSAREEMWELHSAIAAILFDSTIEYRERVVQAVPYVSTQTLPGGSAAPSGPGGGTTQPGGGVVSIGPTGHGTQPAVQITYRYRDKVPPSQADRQVREWTKEFDDLAENVEGWEVKRREQLRALATKRTHREAVERRFRSYEATGISRVAEPHLVVPDKTDLYDGKYFIRQLRSEEIVLARPNTQHKDWLRVQTTDRVLDGRSRDYLARSRFEIDTAGRTTELRQYIADLQSRIDLLTALDKQLRSLGVSLTYESRLTRLPLASYPFGADYPGRTYYRTGLVPKQVTQMVDLSRARSVQRDWDAEREDLQDDLKSLRKDLENARTDLAVTEAQAAERIRRFRIADPAGRGAPLTEPAQ